MEAVSGVAGWDGLAQSSSSASAAVAAAATSGWVNLTSALFPGTGASPNGTHGGSYFWLFPENGTGSPLGTPAPPRQRDPALARAEIGVLGLVLALTTLGNSFVLWVLLRRRKHNAPMHIFMVNLCLADLVVAFFQVRQPSFLIVAKAPFTSNYSRLCNGIKSDNIFSYCLKFNFEYTSNERLGALFS